MLARHALRPLALAAMLSPLLTAQAPCDLATTTTLGAPCGSAQLTTSPPVLGQTLAMHVDGAAAGLVGSVFHSAPAAAPTPLLGCDIHLSALDVAGVFLTDGNGDGEVLATLPNDPSLCGAELVVQAAIFSGTGPVLGMEVSNAALLRAGEQPPTGGTFPADWIHGSQNCGQNQDPPLQVHEYAPGTWILRQNACLNFEAPFLYLLAGDTDAILIDTGATSSASAFPVRATVQALLDGFELANGLPDLHLTVAHSHAHGDHVQGDAQFAGQPDTTIVGTGLTSVRNFFGITNWPTQLVTFELGGRTLDVIPCPGHHSTHIAFYDRRTGAFFTGDTFYPGYLFISNLADYRASIARLVAFTATHPITDILGGHIEMRTTPGIWYPYGTVYQPDERDLPLALPQLLELDTALMSIFGPTTEIHDDFIIRVF